MALCRGSAQRGEGARGAVSGQPRLKGKLQAKSLLLVRTSGRALIRHLALSPQTSNNERRQAQAGSGSTVKLRPAQANSGQHAQQKRHRQHLPGVGFN